MIAQAAQVTRLTDEVEAIGSALAPNRTLRTVCPCCGGGSTKESSFCITRTAQGRLLYKCFRATCHWRGSLIDGAIANPEPAVPFSRRLREFRASVSELTDNQLEWFRQRFGLGPDPDTLYCDSKDMYAYRVRGPDRQLRGWQLRAYHAGAPLRADNYVMRDEPFMSWYFPKDKEIGAVVVVEDIPSARKVALCGVAAVAMLGSSLDYERAYEIGDHSEGFTILAMDRGTLPQALNYRDKYEAIWGTTEIWQLDKDLKDVSRKRIREALYDGKSDFISNPDKQE